MSYVFILWTDASSEDAWTDRDNVNHHCNKVESVGIVVKECDKILTLALNHDIDRDSFSCIISIPKSCIIMRKNIEYIK